MTIVPRLQNSSYRHQPKEKKTKTLKILKRYRFPIPVLRFAPWRCLGTPRVEIRLDLFLSVAERGVSDISGGGAPISSWRRRCQLFGAAPARRGANLHPGLGPSALICPFFLLLKILYSLLWHGGFRNNEQRPREAKLLDAAVEVNSESLIWTRWCTLFRMCVESNSSLHVSVELYTTRMPSQTRLRCVPDFPCYWVYF